MNFGRRDGFASLRGIASARLADLVGPNAVASHERLRFRRVWISFCRDQGYALPDRDIAASSGVAQPAKCNNGWI
jgi:hypothetical protein